MFSWFSFGIENISVKILFVLQVNSTMIDIVAKCLGIQLTKTESELQHIVIKAELVPSTKRTITSGSGDTKTSICSIQ